MMTRWSVRPFQLEVPGDQEQRMESVRMIGKVLLILFAIAGVAVPLVVERRNYAFVWSVWRRFRITMFLECAVVVALTIALAVALWQVPGLRYGWLNLFFNTGGNALLAPVQAGSESSSVVVRLLVLAFLIAFAFVLPFMARFEERAFRLGHYDWRSIVAQSVKFGLVHCVVGVPIAAGIALICSGLFYGYKYQRAFNRNAEAMGSLRAAEEAVMVTTTYHTMYNMIVVGLLLSFAFAAV